MWNIVLFFVIEILGAGVKSVNTRVVFGNWLNNQIFKVSNSKSWKNQNPPIIISKVFTEFIPF